MKKTIKSIEENKIYKSIVIGIVLIGLSLLIMVITFALSSATLNEELFESYLNSPLLMLMNLIPIILTMSLIYLVSNKLWLGFSLTSLIFVAMGLVNKLKLTYRDDPLKFLDLKLFGESIKMASVYDISISHRWVIVILGLVLISLLLKIFLPLKINSQKSRIYSGSVLLLASAIIFSQFYFKEEVYSEVGDKSIINEWIESQQLQSKGLVYQFIYSIQSTKQKPPEGYEKKKAKADLLAYNYKDIDPDKKVNVISIMLEAYNDFSEFEDIEFNKDVYEYFHKLKEESISGKLITNVFAGGTINTEMGFITGYNHHPTYKENTNAFPWYFREQGYKTEAMHPITGSFYNRRNANDYLGFENFDYYENKYKEVQPEPLMDMRFFDFILEGYENSIREGRPYFHFSVTYQNHGPYSDEKLGEEEYIKKKPAYNDSDYNIANNYLRGIYETNLALEKLVTRLEASGEPVVLLLFGDHNPWLGKDNSTYNMLNINMDLGNIEGFKNYYQTPYLIWGNDQAKQALNRDFIGEGSTVSPNHLMTELFDYIGWEGNEYMQYLSKLKKEIPVNHSVYFKENGKFMPSAEIGDHTSALWKEFKNIEYYTKSNFSQKIGKQ